MNIGFSTGFLHKEISPTSIRALEICRTVSTEAIEINCIGGLHENGHSASLIGACDVSGFRQVSLHSPSKVRYGNDASTRDLLAEIQKMCLAIPVKVVVFHPDLVDCWEIFSEFDIPYAFENMDHRKTFGKSVSDLRYVFSRCDSGFVLDLNHCYSIDPTMATARELIERFGDRLCEIHLSGFAGYHELLCDTLQTGIMDAMPDLDVPIILESGCESVTDVRREYEYVSAYMRNR